MTTDNIIMPAAVREETHRLLAAITRASTGRDAEHAGLRAEGFVLGVERLKAMKPESIEALYLVFEVAVEMRIGELDAIEGPPQRP